MADTVQSNELSGSTLDGRWEVLERLAYESESVLYRARQIATERDVWLRVIEEGPPPGTERFDHWMSVVRTAVSLRHPNTLATLGSGATQNGEFYIITDPVPGESLRAKLDREGTLALDDAARILGDVCLSLTEAHSIGVFHGALCPRSVHLSTGEDGSDHTLVADYGVARLLSRRARAETDTLPGIDPAEYRAPEVDDDEENTSARSDIYSLAVVLLESMLGRQGTGGKKWVSSLWEVEGGATAPAIVDNLLAGALARSPASRIPSAGLFRERLVETRGDQPLAGGTVPFRRLATYRTALENFEEEEQAEAAADRANAIASAALPSEAESQRLRRHRNERIVLLSTIGVLLICVTFLGVQLLEKASTTGYQKAAERAAGENQSLRTGVKVDMPSAEDALSSLAPDTVEPSAPAPVPDTLATPDTAPDAATERAPDTATERAPDTVSDTAPATDGATATAPTSTKATDSRVPPASTKRPTRPKKPDKSDSRAKVDKPASPKKPRVKKPKVDLEDPDF